MSKTHSKYICDICHKEFNKKHNYDKHMNRKIPCETIINHKFSNDVIDERFYTSTKPPIKWAGGKTLLIPHIQKLIYGHKSTVRYVDLFCGSLAIPLKIRPQRALFNDVNDVLINFYKVIQNYPKRLWEEIEEFTKQKYNMKDMFNQFRDEYNELKLFDKINSEQKIRLALLFLYLNKRSFNGLYRENKSGKYNVPYREYKGELIDENTYWEIVKYFKEADITFTNVDYKKLEGDIKGDDLVYIDPPYYPSEKSNFTSYWKTPFLKEHQRDLSEFVKRLINKGCNIIISNSPCDEIKSLYEELKMEEFYIGRQMRSGKGKSKVYTEKEPNEILIWNE